MPSEPAQPRAPLPPAYPVPLQAPNSQASLRNLVIVVHGLYAASLITGFTSIVGLIIAYIKRPETVGTIYESHMTYAIRTFWIGFIAGAVSFFLVFLLIGIPMLIAIGIWFIVRIVRALLAILDDKPIAKPLGWF
jgi:uncharacterized membrane protein